MTRAKRVYDESIDEICFSSFSVIFGLDPEIQKNIIVEKWIPDKRFRE